MTSIVPDSAISVAVFSPQNSAPKRSYLEHVRSSLLSHSLLEPIRSAIDNLPETWEALATAQPSIANLKDVGRLVGSFRDWMRTGESGVLETEMSGAITLPLLTIIHIVQYLGYLNITGRSHADLLQSLEGGVQGYCIGLLSATIVASSSDEKELVKKAATGIRLALAIGAFGDLGEASSENGSATVVLRLRSPSIGEKILQDFPGAYVSTVNDSRTISMIVPADNIDEFRTYTEKLGLQPRPIHIQSRLHDPNNVTLAEQCREWCNTLDGLPFGGGGDLSTCVRSNRTGDCLSEITHSLSSEIIDTILASQCDWTRVIRHLVDDLQESEQQQHTLAMFGVGDCVPLELFRQHEIDIVKLSVLTLTTTATSSYTPTKGLESFPADSIAIIGAGCRLPGANSLDELWNIISQGKSRLERLRSDRANLTGSFRATQDKGWVGKREFWGNYVDNVDCFDNSFFGISPREAKYMDPQQRLLLETAFDAMDSSGYLRHHQREHGDNVGCFLGASYTEYLENTSSYSPSAFTATGTIRAFLSGKISYHFGWSGPSEVIDTACSASIVAVHRACQAIKSGECPIALAGGVNLITGINNYFDLGKASFLSPTGQCKPFDESADGYCRADGVGLVVLKSLRQAVADGDLIMGVIPAVATNQGGIHAPGITVPDGVAQKALYKKVLANSGFSKEDVSYVEAHGTGTQVGDPIEIHSIREVFGGSERSNPVYLGSLKANIGHSETAAGVASLLKVLTMFRHKGIPPLQGFKRLNYKIPSLDPDKIQIPTNLIPWNDRQRVACINSYGASGSNSALLCAEWVDTTSHTNNELAKTPAVTYPILLSAASSDSLRKYMEHLATYLHLSTANKTLSDVAYTLSERRKHHRVRWSTTASELSQLVDQLQRPPVDDFVEIPKTPKKVILAFSGQSRTNIGLDAAVYQSYPTFQKHIKACNEILQSLGGPDIVPFLSQSGEISDPVILQCGTVAVQYACAQSWIDTGLKVDAVVGHSLGELSALAVSGILSLKDTLKAVFTRAKLMKTKWGPDRGTMLAIHAKLEVVQSVLKLVAEATEQEDDELEIACYNSISSHIVVGKEESILVAEKILNERPQLQGTRFQRVGVSHGFHSRFTKPLLLDLIRLEKTLKFKKPTIPLETSSQIPSSFGASDSAYFAHHARDPVYFYDAVHRLEKRLGSSVWLEAGWGSPIIAMTKKALANPLSHTLQAVTSPATVSANLWREGLDCSFWGFLSPKHVNLKPVWLPPYCFESNRSWMDHVDNAIEVQKAAASNGGFGESAAISQSPRLVLYAGFASSGNSTHEFNLQTSTERYNKIVSGHAVRHKPLCPASVYMEAAIMAAETIGDITRGKIITFSNIAFHRPLGRGESLDVKLHLASKTETRDKAWHFTTLSLPKSVYSEGDFSTSTSPPRDMELYGLLASQGILALNNDPEAERLRKRTVYSLFSRVVEYSDLMQGISEITMGSRQALARIRVPKYLALTSESTVSDYFDAIALDTFIQVVGLLINCNNESTETDDIYIASSIGNMVILPTDFQQSQTWTVYATYSIVDSKTIGGAIFIFSEAGKLTVVGSEIRFVKTEAAKLERVLEAANPTANTSASPAAASTGRQLAQYKSSPRAADDIARPNTINGGLYIPNNISGSESRNIASSKIPELKSLVSAYTGLKIADIQDALSFSSLGIDSLSAMELASEIETTLGIKVNSDDILTGSINTIAKLLPPLLCVIGPSDSLESGIDSSSSPSEASTDDGLPPEAVTPSDHGSILQEFAPAFSFAPWVRPNTPLKSRYKIETVVYKKIDGIEVPADIYIPSEAPSQPMPIALMIHGGGHMTLSRRAVRPAQTSYLLANGILPVSLDYRLCPQVNVLDGPMADIRDACKWAQQELPKIMSQKNITIDPTKYVVVGWSTGGTLAMTTAWTLLGTSFNSPLAILSFYCPVEYNPDEPITMGGDHSSRTMSFSQIRETLPTEPTTSHAFNSLDTTKLGWLQKDDPRSELVLALVKEENGMSLLFNGLPSEGECLPRANAERAAAFSPLVQVRSGNYHVPTYLVFGEEDEIAPFSKAVEFQQALKDKCVRGGFLPVKGAKHIYDLGLSPGSQGWDKGVGPGYNFLFQEIEGASRVQ